MSSAKELFKKPQSDRIVEAIRLAEAETSGEVRVYVEDFCTEAPIDRAKKLFFELEMHKTQQNNGTLVYLAVRDHKFAILGDKGIDAAVPDGFWDSVRDTMRGHFVEGRFVEGLSAAVSEIGQKLKAYFPKPDDDVNELPDEVVIG